MPAPTFVLCPDFHHFAGRVRQDLYRFSGRQPSRAHQFQFIQGKLAHSQSIKPVMAQIRGIFLIHLDMVFCLEIVSTDDRSNRKGSNRSGWVDPVWCLA